MPKRTLLALGVSGLAVLIVAGLAQCPPSAPLVEAALSPARPECPRHDQMLAFVGESLVTRPTFIAASADISTIPEYHDCQRLLVFDGNGQRKFGPLIGIFARIHAEQVGDPEGFVAPVPAARAGVSPSLRTGLKLASLGTDSGRDTAVVTILDYDEGYEPLHIPRGYSCLYVYRSGSAWAARLVQAPDDAACTHTLDPAAPGWDLGVIPTLDPNPAPVARWDWDKESKEHYIGVRCGSSWCEVYNQRRTHVSSPTYGGVGKGWYDEQYLAVNSTGPQSRDGLEPGVVQGTFTPISDLADHDDSYFSVWQPMARANLSDDSPAYTNKYSFDKGPAPNGLTLVYLCKGDFRDCVPFPHSAPNCENGTDKWWAKIVSPKGTKYRCVNRYRAPPGAPLPPPGLVRWRWKLVDDGMWIRCPAGCCQVN